MSNRNGMSVCCNAATTFVEDQLCCKKCYAVQSLEILMTSEQKGN